MVIDIIDNHTYHVTYEPDSINNPAVDSTSLGRRCLVVIISNNVKKIGLVCTAWLYQSGIQLFISFGNNSGLFTAQIAQNITQTSYIIYSCIIINRLLVKFGTPYYMLLNKSDIYFINTLYLIELIFLILQIYWNS